MSYTSGAAMDERGLRDIERWRDKIEVRLDNRQVFFLFFGSALVACLLFVLGVIVGKRLESRGRAVAPEAEDPLALLDKVAAAPRASQAVAVTFPQTLFGKTGATGKKAGAKPDPKPVETTSLDVPKPEAAKLVQPAKPEPAKPAQTAKPEDKAGEGAKGVARPVAEDEPARAAAPKSAEAAKPEAKQVAKLDVKTPESANAVPQTKLAPKPTEAKAAAVPVIAATATEAAKSKTRFTLQLSSFQTRGEAEAFAKKFDAEKTYMVVSEIPGKGTWYRVRLGDFASAKDALAGKVAFEKRYGVIAYVAQR